MLRTGVRSEGPTCARAVPDRIASGLLIETGDRRHANHAVRRWMIVAVPVGLLQDTMIVGLMGRVAKKRAAAMPVAARVARPSRNIADRVVHLRVMRTDDQPSRAERIAGTNIAPRIVPVFMSLGSKIIADTEDHRPDMRTAGLAISVGPSLAATWPLTVPTVRRSRATAVRAVLRRVTRTVDPPHRAGRNIVPRVDPDFRRHIGEIIAVPPGPPPGTTIVGLMAIVVKSMSAALPLTDQAASLSKVTVVPADLRSDMTTTGHRHRGATGLVRRVIGTRPRPAVVTMIDATATAGRDRLRLAEARWPAARWDRDRPVALFAPVAWTAKVRPRPHS